MGLLETFVHTISRDIARSIADSLTQKELERLNRANKDPELLELEKLFGVELVSIERLSYADSYESGRKWLKVSRKQLENKIFGDPESELVEASILVTTIENTVRNYISKGMRYGLNDSRLIESRIAIINKLLKLMHENLSFDPTQATRYLYLKQRLNDSKKDLLKCLNKEF